jgi:CheY-like chemotaxis protein/HEAT repeat protein
MSEAACVLQEIADNVAKNDAIKAQLVLDYLPHLDESTQAQVLGALAKAPAAMAIPLAARLADTQPDLVARHSVVREILAIKLLGEPHVLETALPALGLRALELLLGIIAELKLEAATEPLLEFLATLTDPGRIEVVIRTLGEIGDPVATNALGDYLYSGNRKLIIAAIQALGKIATPTAMRRLAERMGTDNQLDILILDIFARVQDTTSLEKLNEAMRSHFAHIRTYAKKALVEIGAKAVPLLTDNLRYDDPDLVIHTLNVLGDIGDAAAIAPIRKLLHTQPKNPNVRFAAYEALGLLPLDKGAYVLTQGLLDPVEHVAVAAARAVDRNFTPILGAGIKNMAENDDDAARITRTVVQAHAGHIFLALVDDSRLAAMLLDAVLHAHQDTREHFYALLKENGYSELALRLMAPRTTEQPRRTIVAVDDSRMILSIYKNTLHELGFEPVLFEFPASALEWLETNTPAMVLTDLNMPDITGIELTRRIRERFSKEALPVLMVTTQSEMNDHKAALEAGVNAIVNKPFTAESLMQAMEPHLQSASQGASA